MKPSTLLALGASVVSAFELNPLSYGAFSEPVHSLEVRAVDAGPAVVTALYQIGNATVALNTLISSFTVSQLLGLQAKSSGLVSTINQAITNVSGSTGMVSTEYLIPVVTATGSLATLVNTTIQNVMNHKMAFGGASPVVLNSLQAQQNATFKLTSAIEAKLPSALLKEAATETLPIFTAFSEGIKNFSSPNVNPPSVYQVAGAGSLSTSFGALACAFGFASMFLL